MFVTLSIEMSLLEDVFLQDEANEAQELERVIEGDDYDERRRSLSPSDDENDDGNREDEAEEDKRRVDPASTKAKKVAKNPRFILNPARLTGPRGIQVIPEHFKDFKFKGKGHEKEDLDLVLKKLEHWAYRLYPKFAFQDCLKKIETLGKKRPVMVHLHKIRTDQFLSEDTVVQKDSSDDEAQPPQEEDEFDKLLRQQIELARATPAPGSIKKDMRNDNWARLTETPIREDRSVVIMPKAISSPSISEEQKERMLRNRKLAEEKRLARLKQATHIDNSNNTVVETDESNKSKTNVIVDMDSEAQTDNIEEIAQETVVKKINKSNVIESSDSEDEGSVMTDNQSLVVDIHENNIGRNLVDHQENGKKIENDNVIVDIDSKKQTDNIEEIAKETVPKRVNKSNVIESSDSEDECEVTTVNQSIVVDIHKTKGDKNVIDDEEIGNKTNNDESVNFEELIAKNKDYDSVCTIENNEDNIYLNDKNENINDNNVAKISDEIISIVEEEDRRYNNQHHIENKLEPNINSDKDQNELLVDMEIVEDKCIESIDTEANLTTDMAQSTLQKETAEDIVEDIMDVDFSDDF